MNETLIINGMEIPCTAYRSDFYVKERAIFIVDMPMDEVMDLFTDGVLFSVRFINGEVIDCSDYRVLESITYKNMLVTVRYRKMTDLEKLIELHYGGVNNEGSI